MNIVVHNSMAVADDGLLIVEYNAVVRLQCNSGVALSRSKWTELSKGLWRTIRGKPPLSDWHASKVAIVAPHDLKYMDPSPIESLSAGARVSILADGVAWDPHRKTIACVFRDGLYAAESALRPWEGLIMVHGDAVRTLKWPFAGTCPSGVLHGDGAMWITGRNVSTGEVRCIVRLSGDDELTETHLRDMRGYPGSEFAAAELVSCCGRPAVIDQSGTRLWMLDDGTVVEIDWPNGAHPIAIGPSSDGRIVGLCGAGRVIVGYAVDADGRAELIGEYDPLPKVTTRDAVAMMAKGLPSSVIRSIKRNVAVFAEYPSIARLGGTMFCRYHVGLGQTYCAEGDGGQWRYVESHYSNEGGVLKVRM